MRSKINVRTNAHEKQTEMQAAILDSLMTDRHETVLAPGLIAQQSSPLPPPSLSPPGFAREMTSGQVDTPDISGYLDRDCFDFKLRFNNKRAAVG